MAFANTPVEYYKWAVQKSQRNGYVSLYAGDDKQEAGKKVSAILENKQTKISEIRVFYCGQLDTIFQRNRETGKWKAIQCRQPGGK